MRRWSFQYYLLISPALLLSLAVVVVPGAMTFFVAFTDWNGVSLDLNWVGFANFQKIFSDRIFWNALGHNFRWTLLFLTIPVAIGLLTAMLLLKRRRTKTLYQLIYLGPLCAGAGDKRHPLAKYHTESGLRSAAPDSPVYPA